jgi:hypothetical protein
VFVGDEVLLDIGYVHARSRLARLAREGLLLGSSEDAYQHGAAALSGAGRGDAGPGPGAGAAWVGPGPGPGAAGPGAAWVGPGPVGPGVAWPGPGAAGLARVGPPGLVKLVRVQVRELAERGGCARWAIRWEATGTGGALFPVLDADIRLVPAGDRSTVLGLTGSYRPPFGPLGAALDRAILHRVAAATIRNFLARVAARITMQPGPAETVPADADCPEDP